MCVGIMHYIHVSDEKHSLTCIKFLQCTTHCLYQYGKFLFRTNPITLKFNLFLEKYIFSLTYFIFLPKYLKFLKSLFEDNSPTLKDKTTEK